MKIALPALLTSAALSVAPMANAATVGYLDGALSPQGYVTMHFNGTLCDAPDVCVPVPGYSNIPTRASIDAAQPGLDEFIRNEKPVLVFGLSEGAQTIYQYARQHPESTQVFLVTGNPERKYGGVFYTWGGGDPAGGQITDVAVNYDMFADFPNNPQSPYYALAVANAFTQGLYTHLFAYNTADLNDPNATRFTEGNITYVNIPQTPWLGTSAMIEDAYIRPTQEVASSTPIATASGSASTLTSGPSQPLTNQDVSASPPAKTHGHSSPTSTTGSVSGKQSTATSLSSAADAPHKSPSHKSRTPSSTSASTPKSGSTHHETKAKVNGHDNRKER